MMWLSAIPLPRDPPYMNIDLRFARVEVRGGVLQYDADITAHFISRTQFFISRNCERYFS